MQKILVTDNQKAWSFLESEIEIVDALVYLSSDSRYEHQSIRVINLCERYDYQMIGYYVSLLAEARKQKVFPSITAIQDTLNVNVSEVFWPKLDDEIQRALNHIKENNVEIDIYFKHCHDKKYKKLSHTLSELFPLPLIRVSFKKAKRWKIHDLRTYSVNDIDVKHASLFKQYVFGYVCKYPSTTLYKKGYRLAILIDSKEKTAPSNQKALEKFVLVGEQLGLEVDLISKEDVAHLKHYDALFIRATTSVNHYTYQIAREAEKEGLIVIDDPASIVRCTNKIFLAELFKKNNILTPATYFISRYDTTFPKLDFPFVLKKPDGSCSKGVIKIDNLSSFKKGLKRYFKSSEMLLLQAFVKTAFDWRIGVIDGQPLYACRYYMAKDHWQIVNWNCAIEDDILIHETVSLEEVPKNVIQLALKATKPIGRSLYGVDIKSVGKANYVIEVNDNPSINFGIEDKVLQDRLYEIILSVFLDRLRTKALV